MRMCPTQAEIAIEGRPLLECDRVDVVAGLTRLYFAPILPRGGGFNFFVAHFESGASNPPEGGDYMDSADTNVECLFHGTAFFDGVRHLYTGDEASGNVGYLNYVPPSTLVRVFAALAEVERTYCNSPSETP